MAYDIYIIILTGFAVFGMYCFIDTALTFFSIGKMPASVMIMKNDMKDTTFRKVKFAEQNMPNNYTVLYPFDSETDGEKQLEILNSYLEDVLNVKSVNNW
ncbi:MAG: hypothetical protein E7488_00690 [Ruminococcaceae bacterium]|nr:hypothetical protein [Oscillospiraceae bacterium]